MAEPEIPETKAVASTLMATLQVRGATLATAESMTGGLLGAFVTGVPGASAVYLGGVVTYATEIKQELLKIPEEIVEEDGVVSARCAEAMASRCTSVWRARTGPDRWLSTSTGTGLRSARRPARRRSRSSCPLSAESVW
jgi:nicotinamide mononucleotide (NMN) deamidase PncC